MPSKIRIVDRFVNPFAGAFSCIEEMKNAGLYEFIDEQLGKRVKQARYSFSEIILSWAITNLCSGRRLDDLTHIRKLFNQQGLNLPSADTLSRCIRTFAAAPLNVTSKFKKTHQFCFNPKLNKLLIDVAKKLELIHHRTGRDGNMLDYDGTVIECEKYDSTFTYDQCSGYSPACGFIGRVPVYIEGRSGHTPALFYVAQSIKKCIETLKENGVRIERFRADSAAFTKQTVEYLSRNSVIFYIRAAARHDILKRAFSVDEWKKVEIDGRPHSVFSMVGQFGKTKKLRYVLEIDHDTENAKKKVDGVETKPTIRIICTNDHSLTDVQVIKLYNQRGKAELNFAALKKDFGWARLPHSALNENVSFMYFSSIAHVIYTYLLERFSFRRLIDKSARLKRFIIAIVQKSGWIENDELIICWNSKPPP